MPHLFTRSLYLLLSAVLLSACVGEIDPEFSFNIDREFAAVIPASAVGIDTTFSFNIVDSADEFIKNSTTRDRVLRSTVLKIGARSPFSLSVLDSVQYYVVADQLPRVHIGTLTPLPDANVFVMNPADTNLAEYFKLQTFQLDVRAISSRALAQDTPIEFEQTFQIIATPRQ